MSVFLRPKVTGMTIVRAKDGDKHISEDIDIVANNCGEDSVVMLVSKAVGCCIGVSTEDILRAIAEEGDKLNG